MTPDQKERIRELAERVDRMWYTCDPQHRAMVDENRAWREKWLSEDKHSCRKCGGRMAAGVALQSTSTMTGIGDFHDADRVVTLSEEFGGGEMVPCWKCQQCGWSVSMSEAEKQEAMQCFGHLLDVLTDLELRRYILRAKKAGLVKLRQVLESELEERNIEEGPTYEH